MLNLSILVFAIAAAGGLILAVLHFRGKHRPWPLAVVAFLTAVFPLELMGLAGWGTACLPVAATGLADIIALANKPAAADTAMRHMAVMLGAALLFGLGLFIKGGAGPVEGTGAIAILGLSLSGTLLLLWGGWLGGELVHRYGATKE